MKPAPRLSGYYKPCPCGGGAYPLPVVERGRRKQKLIRVRCPDCRLTSKGARLERVQVAWNVAVEEEEKRRKYEATGATP